MATIRISVPETASKDEVIELKALIQHPMETGYRRNSQGKVIERDIITSFACTYNGETIFEAEMHPGIAANPIFTFYAKARESGPIKFTWTDQNGETWSESRTLSVG